MAVRDSETDLDLEPYRRELNGYCYRMLGSGFEAEDAVQETMVRAWRNAERFEGRSSLRSWLYRIATNVCIDMQRQVQRRARPMEMGPPSPPDESHLGPLLPGGDLGDARPRRPRLPDLADPAEVAEYRESIRLAFVTALQHLPARQRAALVLCDVLRWPAAEVAELLETSTAAVNSALQRARTTLSSLPDASPAPLDEPDTALLERYVDAFERYDIERLVALLHDDAVQSMPPVSHVGPRAEGHRRLHGPARAERLPGFAAAARRGPTGARPSGSTARTDPVGGYAPWACRSSRSQAGPSST